MALPLVTAAVTLFYLGAIPVCSVFHWRSGERFRFGISVFESRFAHMRTHRPRPEHHEKPKLHPADILQPAKYLLKHLVSARIDGSFGTGDAAATALICGGVRSIGHALRCATGRSVRLSLTPVFSADRLQAELSGMISLRAGHIMLAALLGVFEYASGRISQWTSIPSKAS